MDATEQATATGIDDTRLHSWKADVDVWLASWVEALTSADDAPAELRELRQAIAYSVLAPGKRIRPLLTMAATDACGGSPDHALAVGCAVELVHAYSLVHDDLPSMDDDDMRRGRPTSHVVHGEGVAILVGDALQAEAFSVIASLQGLDADRRIRLVECLSGAIGVVGMVGGQYLDVTAAGADVAGVHRLKTAALLAASVEAGGIVAGADEPTCDALRTFGTDLGQLFQQVDDLLDETATSEQLGKPAGSDRDRSLQTAISTDGLAAAVSQADHLYQRLQTEAAGLPNGGAELVPLAAFIRNRTR